jgi:hypothetical protein
MYCFNFYIKVRKTKIVLLKTFGKSRFACIIVEFGYGLLKLYFWPDFRDEFGLAQENLLL